MVDGGGNKESDKGFNDQHTLNSVAFLFNNSPMSNSATSAGGVLQHSCHLHGETQVVHVVYHLLTKHHFQSHALHLHLLMVCSCRCLSVHTDSSLSHQQQFKIKPCKQRTIIYSASFFTRHKITTPIIQSR